MGYRALKEKREEKKKILKSITLCIFLALTLVFVVCSCIWPHASWKYYFSKPKVGKRAEGELRIHFLDVGQGDCVVLELPDGQVALIDGGDGKAQTKKQVLRYLNALKIDKVDHLVITHTDKDHCGSLDEVFRYKKVVNAYLPRSYDEQDVEYAEAYAAALEEKCALITNSRNVNLSRLTDTETPYTLQFLYPYSVEAEESSEKESCVIWLDYMGVGALFCGDASAKVEELLVRDDRLGLFAPQNVTLRGTEILKVAHHGSASSSSQEFLTYLGVETAVISCGKDNAYGHPAAAVLERLTIAKAEVRRTDREGHIVITVKPDGSYYVRALGA